MFSILNSIAENSGGEAMHAIPSGDLQSWFNANIENMLHEGSPQVVLDRKGNNISGEVTYSFDLNALVKSLVIDLSSNNIDISFKKDGIDMDPYAKKTPGSGLNINFFHFPITEENNLGSEGKWEMTLTGNTSKPYYLSVIADDHYLNYNCELNKKVFLVGESMVLTTKIAHIGTPITGANNKVTAVILKPSDDIGHLLSIYETNFCDTTNEDITDGVAQKYANLMANEIDFYNALLPDEQVIELNDLGNGEYSGTYSGTNISGPYNVIYLISGEIPNLGKFERKKIVSSIVVNDGSSSNISVFSDTELPTSPSNLRIADLTETSFKIKWDPAYDYHGIDKYYIYQNGLLIKELNFNKCMHNIYQLAPGTEYAYYITAKDASGNVSANSNNLVVNTLGEKDFESPSIPLNLSATDIKQSQAYLTWNPSNDNTEVTFYDLYINNFIIVYF